MREITAIDSIDNGIFELTNDEIDCVSGGVPSKATMAAGLAGAIGVGTFGAGWMSVAVGTAWAAAPVVVVGMVGLAAYAGYQYIMTN
jgi:hypothetical protein